MKLIICSLKRDEQYYLLNENINPSKNAFILQTKITRQCERVFQALMSDQDGIIIDKKVQRL